MDYKQCIESSFVESFRVNKPDDGTFRENVIRE